MSFQIRNHKIYTMTISDRLYFLIIILLTVFHVSHTLGVTDVFGTYLDKANDIISSENKNEEV